MAVEDTRSTLLIRLKDRADEGAWRTFNRLYRPMIVGYACSRGLKQPDAEDVAQQCIKAVLANIDEYEHVGSFKAWLRTITENKINDLMRGRKAYNRESDILAQQPAAGPDPAQLWERRWLAEHLRFCVEKVKSDIAEQTFLAFFQNVIEERPAKETADRLGISVNQVYVAKFRVLERIRALLLELSGLDLAKQLA